MKKQLIIITIVITGFQFAVFSQEKEMYTLPTFTNLIKGEMEIGNIYMGLLDNKSMIYVYDINKLSDFQRDVLILTLTNQIVTKGDSTIGIPKQGPPYLPVYEQHRKTIFDAFKNIDLSVSVLKTCIADFGIKNGKDTCISLGLFVFDKRFNSLRTNEKERSTQVISELIMPIAHKIFKSFIRTNIKYVAITGCYIKKDFADKYAWDEGCTVSCIINLPIFKKVADLEITEEEFLKETEVFLSDETDIKKVQLY